MAKATLTNTAPGARGVQTLAGLVYLQPGETREVEALAANLAGLDAFGLTTDGPVQDDDDDEPQGDGLDDLDVAALDQLIATEVVTLPEKGSGKDGAILKADKVAAIRAARQKPADELDGMDDETLRATVQALTGAEPAADATRADLLALARAA